MELFRLVRKPHALPLSGKGAALMGGRWNSVGVEIIYTATNRSLAMAEVAVHFSLATLPADYVMLTLEAPDNLAVTKIVELDLPEGWQQFPPLQSTQHIGNNFVAENRYCLLQVPSAVTQGDFNVLINSHHKDFSRIKVFEMVPFPFDKRLLR